MASDSLLKVIAGLVKREGRIAREDAKKAKEALKAEAEKDEEEDEDEDPVGTPEGPTDDDDEGEWEPPAAEPEADAEPDSGEGDTKPTGPDPALVAQVARIVKQEIEDEAKKDKGPGEIKLSGKKEKIDTKPKMEQRNKMTLSFNEAIRLSVTGTQLSEGYEQVVLEVLEDEGIDGPLGYEPFFEKGNLFVQKGSERAAKKALQQSRDISKLPKIIGEEFTVEEYLAMETVDVDGRCKGFKEALRRLTYEKIKLIKKSLEKDIKESGESTSYWMPEGLTKEGAAEFMAAASAAKKAGKKKFKFGDPPKEYPVTIKVDIPLKGEQKEGRLTSKENELVESIMALSEGDYDKLLDESTEVQIEGLGGLLGKALGGLGKMGKWMIGFDDEIASKKKADKAEARLKKAKAISFNKDRLKKAQDELAKLDQSELEKDPAYKAAQKEITDQQTAQDKYEKDQGKELKKAEEEGEEIPDEITKEVKKAAEIKVPEPVKTLATPASDDDTPPAKDDDTPPAKDDDTPPAKDDDTPPAKDDDEDDDVEKDEKGNIAKASDAEDWANAHDNESPPGWKRDPKDKDKESGWGLVPSDTKESLTQTMNRIVNESNELQAIMALDDVGIKAEINRKGQVTVKKKDLKKAEKALSKSFKKGGEPDLYVEEVETDEVDEMKLSPAAKKKKALWAKTPAGKKSLLKSKKRSKKVKSGAIKIDKAKGRAMAKARKKGGIRSEFVPDGSMIKRWKEGAFDKIKTIRNRLGEGLDAHAARELQLYIEQDRDLYRQQIIPIIKNVQKKMKSGKYDHAKAPKLWMYLVDNGAKKYVKEFGGDVKRDFPKDLRLSVANQFANEYKAEIEIQGGEMI